MFQCKEGTIKPVSYVGIVKNEKLLLVDYHQAPNPMKSGWWIPAPGIEFGRDSYETAEKVFQELGLTPSEIRLFDVESFMTPGGWHLIHHFVGKTESEPKISGNIKAIRWVSALELSEMKDIAHGSWEIQVGLKYLNKP